jgi:hypothetical protein
MGQEDPDGFSEGAGEMGDRRVDADDQVEGFQQGGGFGVVGQPWRQVG